MVVRKKLQAIKSKANNVSRMQRKRLKGCIPSNKLNIDIDQILKMKKTHTLKQISEILSIKVSTIKKRITNHIKRSK